MTKPRKTPRPDQTTSPGTSPTTSPGGTPGTSNPTEPTPDASAADAPSVVEEEAATIDPRDPDAAEQVEELVRAANHGADPGVAITEAGEAGAESADVGRLAASSMCDVTFRCGRTDAERVVLAGDFNAWSIHAHPMHRGDDGFEVTVPLERGRRYQYRFVVDDRWEDDETADEFEPNEYGGRNAVRST